MLHFPTGCYHRFCVQTNWSYTNHCYCDDRSIALYLNCVDALYGENAENHIFKDILDWNTFEDATEPELQNYDYHRSRNAFILAQRQIQILEGMLVKWPESEKAKAWLNAWACRLKQIPEKL